MLAGHTRDMQLDPRVAVLVTAPLEGLASPQALPRVSLQGEAAPCPAAHADHAAARAACLARFADAAPMFGFADFSLWLIRPRTLRLVGGFAQARTLAAEDLVAALNG
jgi:putative heme iron utilization protein